MANNKVNSGLLEFSEDQKVFVALDAETSEVKKAVTIDEDGVETDMLGIQPTGKKEITSTAEVNVASYATAQVVDEDLVAGNIKKDVDILGVVGSYEGGGASDFTTAEISISAALPGTQCSVTSPHILTRPSDMLVADPANYSNGDVITVALYKGKASISASAVSGMGSLSVSGDIESKGDGYYLVTGDGTITIS